MSGGKGFGLLRVRIQLQYPREPHDRAGCIWVAVLREQGRERHSVRREMIDSWISLGTDRLASLAQSAGQRSHDVGVHHSSALVVMVSWLAAAVIVGSCSGSGPSASPTDSQQPSDRSSPTIAAPASPPPGATEVAGGCASTQLYMGAFPTWLEPIVQQLSNMNAVPYGIASDSTAAAFVLGYPLKAGVPHPKILWIVSASQGTTIDIGAHPFGASTPAIKESVRGNASPAGAYPDGLTIPSAGCWQFTISWLGHSTQLDLTYG